MIRFSFCNCNTQQFTCLNKLKKKNLRKKKIKKNLDEKMKR